MIVLFLLMYILLFMKVAILQQKSKFGYLYKFNAERMANTRIMLPVTDEGMPDYQYMEQYAKNMMLRKYKQYLAYSSIRKKKRNLILLVFSNKRFLNGCISVLRKTRITWIR